MDNPPIRTLRSPASSPEGDGPERGRIDVYCRSIIGRLARARRLWCWTGRNCTGHNEGVVPFGPGEGYVVDLGDQNWILMDVEWMVRKRPIDHRPFFIIVGNHVPE